MNNARWPPVLFVLEEAALVVLVTLGTSCRIIHAAYVSSGLMGAITATAQLASYANWGTISTTPPNCVPRALTNRVRHAI